MHETLAFETFLLLSVNNITKQTYRRGTSYTTFKKKLLAFIAKKILDATY